MRRLVLLLAATGCAAAPPESSAISVSSGSTIRLLTETPADVRASCAAMSWPVLGPLSSRFGPRRGQLHQGIDLAVAVGTPVRAACDGTVEYVGSLPRGYGNLVVLRHGAELATLYAHNQLVLVQAGERVLRGQVIARSGQTGHATGPHLHFEVRKSSIARDPLGYLVPP